MTFGFEKLAQTHAGLFELLPATIISQLRILYEIETEEFLSEDSVASELIDFLNDGFEKGLYAQHSATINQMILCRIGGRLSELLRKLKQAKDKSESGGYYNYKVEKDIIELTKKMFDLKEFEKEMKKRGIQDYALPEHLTDPEIRDTRDIAEALLGRNPNYPARKKLKTKGEQRDHNLSAILQKVAKRANAYKKMLKRLSSDERALLSRMDAESIMLLYFKF